MALPGRPGRDYGHLVLNPTIESYGRVFIVIDRVEIFDEDISQDYAFSFRRVNY